MRNHNYREEMIPQLYESPFRVHEPSQMGSHMCTHAAFSPPKRSVALNCVSDCLRKEGERKINGLPKETCGCNNSNALALGGTDVT